MTELLHRYGVPHFCCTNHEVPFTQFQKKTTLLQPQIGTACPRQGHRRAQGVFQAPADIAPMLPNGVPKNVKN